MQLLKLLAKEAHLPLWLTTLLIIAFILRIPSFFEPLWYGDEAIYLALGEGIRQGLLLYKEIHDNKPPLIYVIAAIAGNLFWFKVILAAAVLSATVLFWKLTDFVFPKNKNLGKIATIIFTTLTTLPLIEGNIANAELFMLLTTISAFVILFGKKRTQQRAFVGGLVLGTGILLKAPAALDALVPIVFGLLTLPTSGKLVTDKIRNLIVLAIGIALPFLSFLGVFWLIGNLENYMRAAFVQTMDYISAWRGATSSQGNFISRNGPLLLRGAFSFITIGVFASLYKQKKINTSLLFSSIWFVLSLFAITLSERPYPHYLIQIAPSLSLLLAFAVTDKTRAQFFTYPLFAVLAGALVLFKFYYYPVFPYYLNFLSFVTGNETKEEYFNNFDVRTNRNYKIAKFISESKKENDRVFVWGNDPEIYVLSHTAPPTRFVATYHVTELNGKQEVLNVLSAMPPRYIITTTPSESFPELAMMLGSMYTLVRQEGAGSTSASIYFRTDHLNLKN